MASYSISTRQKDKGWQVIVSYKDRYGKWRQKSKQGFTTKRQAKDYGDVIVKDIKENLLLTNNEELANMTFIEFFRLYMDDIKHTLRPNSILTYQNAVKHLYKIHDIKLCDVTPKIVHEIAREMSLSESNKHFIFGLMKATFRHAIKQYNALSNNPVTIKLNKKTTNIRSRIISSTELNNYYNSSSDDSMYYTAIKILEYTGIRIGELLGLTWNDLDFDQMTLNINKQWSRINMNRDYGFGELKTKNSKRILPIPMNLIVLLKAKKETANNERIIPFNSPSILYNHIKLKINNHSPHDFRHTYATKLLSHGIDIKTVASLLGDTIDTVIKTYIHYSDEMRENARSEIQRIFD